MNQTSATSVAGNSKTNLSGNGGSERTDQVLRIGVLSTAKIAREHLIPAIQNAANCRVAAIASRDAERAQQVATHFHIPETFASYQALLDSPSIDAVYIPLPTSHHIEWAIKAAEAGKHVLCEKPIALQEASISDLEQAAAKFNVIVSEAFMVTYHPQWLKVRDLIRNGAIGKLQHVQAAFSYFNVDPDNMRNSKDLGGGALPDIGVYPVVATRFVTGQEPVKVSASVRFDPVFGTDCYATVRADFDDFELSFYVSTQMALRQSICFHGDEGFIELTAPFNSNLYEGSEVLLHDIGHSSTQCFRFTGIDQYQLQVEAFAKEVLQRRNNGYTSTDEKESAQLEPVTTPLFSLQDSRLNQRVIDGIYQSSENGSEVILKKG